MDSKFDKLVEKLCNADSKAGHTGVRQRAAQEKCSDLKRCLTNIKTKTYLLQALESNQGPENGQGLKGLKKEIHAIKKQTQDWRDNIESKSYAFEQDIQHDDLAQYLILKHDVHQKIAEVRQASADIGVEIQGSGNDDWDWQSQNLLNNYELKAEEQRVQQLEEFLKEKEIGNKELQAQLAALQEELTKRNNLAALPSSCTEWYQDTIRILRGLTGIDDITPGDQKLHIKFSNTEEVNTDAERFQLTVFFSIHFRGDICVAGAECNVAELDLSDVTEHAVANNDLPYLVRNVKKRWQSYEPLCHEIRSLQDRYPVDWLMNERKLRLLCESTAKIMCVLEVGHSYPCLGSISFIQVEGSTHDIIPHLAQKLQSQKLTDWVDYCYSCFAGGTTHHESISV